MVRWLRWHCPPDTGFKIRALAVWGRARYLSDTEAPHNTDFHAWMRKKHFLFLSNRRDREPNPEPWRERLATTLGPPPYSARTWCEVSDPKWSQVWWLFCTSVFQLYITAKPKCITCLLFHLPQQHWSVYSTQTPTPSFGCKAMWINDTWGYSWACHLGPKETQFKTKPLYNMCTEYGVISSVSARSLKLSNARRGS